VRFPFLLCAACCLPGVADARPADWRIEAEAPAHVAFSHGGIEIDTPLGLTLWYRRRLSGAVRISFDAMPIAHGGPNDTVSALNAFWMAREKDGSDPAPRSGRFEDYDPLQTYYVGIGGNRNPPPACAAMWRRRGCARCCPSMTGAMRALRRAAGRISP